MNNTLPTTSHPLIGRDRALADGLTERLLQAIRTRHNYTTPIDTTRGARFDVEILVDDAPSGRMARVTVELLPEDPADRDRTPYVGRGADGARRSAQIDREEILTLDRGDPRIAVLEDSAARWDRQAERLARDGSRS